MSSDIAKRVDIALVDRVTRYGLVMAAVLFGGLDYWAQGANPWFKSSFVVAVAGLVGYFTNFLAIKMLFQPKRGQVLGWRGLVPKNQAHIARSLGASVQEQLLSPDIVLAYVQERKLIEAATQSVAEWLDEKLQHPEVRREITERVVDLVNSRGDEILAGGFAVAEQALKQAAADPQVIEQVGKPVRDVLFAILDSDSSRQKLAQQIQSVVATHLPQIAEWVDSTLEDYLRQQKMAGSLGLGLKNLISLDRDAIADVLRRFTEEPAVARQFMVMIDGVIDGLQRELQEEGAQAAVQDRVVSGVDQVAELARNHLLPVAGERIGEYFQNEENWKVIEDVLMRAIGWSKDRAVTVMSSAEGQELLRRGIEKLVRQLDVRNLVEQQVMKLDTDELENMVLDNTGGNLTIIQVLGGALGVVAGTVQVHLFFAAPIAVLLLVVFVAWHINEWQQARLARRNSGKV